MKPGKFAALCAAGFLSASAHAVSISPGTTLTGITVDGTDSIYQIFGHPGNTGGDTGPATDAVLLSFTAGSSNVFSFTVRGLASCCSNDPDFPPDGGNGGMNITGDNGLSDLVGNSLIPFVGVFTTETDPFGSPSPATGSFDADAPASLSPELYEVFYIGDGHTGRDTLGNPLLTFLAPAGATRLYLGVIDAFGFHGLTGYYHDNNGAYVADVSLNPVPLPGAVWLLGSALGGLAALRRRLA